MRILITGGTGLIGKALVRELLDHGHEPIVLSRNPSRHESKIKGVQFAEWDAQTTRGWGHLVNEVEGIVNLAGENLAGSGFFPARWTNERKERILQSRLQAGQALVAAIEQARHKPQVLIQSSAIGYYGVRADEIISEEDRAGDDFIAQTGVQWEASTEAVEAQGVRRAVIRTGIVLDENDGALMRLLLPYRLFIGGPFGNGRQWYSWIHLADEVASIRFLIENEQARGAFNLTAPNPLTNADFGKALGRVMRRPSLVPLPGFVFRLMFGEVATVVLDGQRVLPQRLLDLGFEFQYPEVEAAFRNILGK